MIKKIDFEKKINWKIKIILLLTFLFTFIYLVDLFFDNYDLNFQSPIIIRTPIILRKREAPKNIKNLPKNSPKKGRKSNLPMGVLAQNSSKSKIEPTITPYPKLMDKKNLELREKVLFYLKTKIKNENEIIAIDNIFKKETGYDPTVVNEIGAGGLCQAYPHTKMNCELSWEDWKCQVDWCLKYIENRYKNPVDAWNFHLINDWF